jgi:hypothetical protein
MNRERVNTGGTKEFVYSKEDIERIELELKNACMEIYMWTSGTSEILDFAEGLC